jgi:hypothetical protein
LPSKEAEVTKKLIEEMVEAEYELQKFVEDTPVRPVPRQPASARELAALEGYLRKAKLPFPPSYRKFLSICNGIDNFMSNFSLLDIAGVMQGPSPNQKKYYPSYAPFVIGKGISLEFLSFETKNPDNDELEVVFVTDEGEESRYDDFRQFMVEHLEALNTELASERADRKKLKKR